MFTWTEYDSAHWILVLNTWSAVVDFWYYGNELPGATEGYEFVEEFCDYYSVSRTILFCGVCWVFKPKMTFRFEFALLPKDGGVFNLYYSEMHSWPYTAARLRHTANWRSEQCNKDDTEALINGTRKRTQVSVNVLLFGLYNTSFSNTW
jgi:hypothetical protein